jgi:phenylalanine-4-hydroxylase
VFEEAQLYSPVTAGDDGSVTVHLAHDHPGANDPAYRARRNEIATAALAWQPGQPNPHIDYTEAEQEVWRTVCRELWPKYEHYAINEFREAIDALALPCDRIPELDEVSQRLEPITGFRYLPAAGLVPLLSRSPKKAARRSAAAERCAGSPGATARCASCSAGSPRLRPAR